MLVFCISAFGILPRGSQAITIIPDEQYWRIDETINDLGGIFPLGTFTITNMHQTDTILGFAVGVPFGKGSEARTSSQKDNLWAVASVF